MWYRPTLVVALLCHFVNIFCDNENTFISQQILGEWGGGGGGGEGVAHIVFGSDPVDEASCLHSIPEWVGWMNFDQTYTDTSLSRGRYN